ncbi:MAG: DUF6290 family protein [Anaerorhabdus sp.]|uniref:DUF6290 family protein n=1 Tax=Anaerorhabdus sp. TaxID=1872524 RepID=UPI003A8B9F84
MSRINLIINENESKVLEEAASAYKCDVQELIKKIVFEKLQGDALLKIINFYEQEKIQSENLLFPVTKLWNEVGLINDSYVKTTALFDQKFKVLNRSEQIVLAKWINNNLVRIANLKEINKSLKLIEKNYYRCEIENFKMIVEIKNSVVIIVGLIC